MNVDHQKITHNSLVSKSMIEGLKEIKGENFYENTEKGDFKRTNYSEPSKQIIKFTTHYLRKHKVANL